MPRAGIFFCRMKAHELAEELLKEGVLNATDAARIVLEMQDALGRRAKRRGKASLMQLLRRVIRAGVHVVAQEEKTVTLERAAWASIESKKDHLRPVSLRDLRYYVRRLLREENAGRQMLRAMTTADCRRILHAAFPKNANGFVKGRAILHSIFAYGIRREWCDNNPVSRIDVPHIRETTIEPLTLDEVSRLRRAARNTDMELSLYLMLYGGIRPTEVARLKPSDFCWRENIVIIRPQTSKTGGGRVVPLRGCRHIAPRFRVIPANWPRRWHALRLAAGFTRWVPDSCRHTFATYHAAHFRNLHALQLEMGHHDLNLLRSRYMRPTSAATARKFWATVKENESGTSP